MKSQLIIGLMFTILCITYPLWSAKAQSRRGNANRFLKKQCRILQKKRSKAYNFYAYVKPIRYKMRFKAESDTPQRVTRGKEAYRQRNFARAFRSRPMLAFN